MFVGVENFLKCRKFQEISGAVNQVFLAHRILGSRTRAHICGSVTVESRVGDFEEE